MIADGMDSVASTSTGPARFGRISENMIRTGPAPSDLAASMYSLSRSEIVWPRTTRAMPAQAKKEMTPMTTGRLGPSTAASASARTMYGNASTASTSRDSAVSVQPPK